MTLNMVETFIIKFNQDIKELSITLSFVRVRHVALFLKVGGKVS